MISLLDCAVLADDVYNREDNNLAISHGWRRVDGQNWPDGFAAGLYEKGNERVIAFRGTDDVSDAIADAQMVPVAEDQRVRSVTPAILRAYGLQDNVELNSGALVLGTLLTHRQTRSAVATWANRAPTNQTTQALAYYDRSRRPPRFVVGHSLGGALAKIVSQRRAIPAIAFNSPFMGSMHGVAPVSSPSIWSVNTIGDPLSLATHQAGNLPHGRTIAVRIARFSRRPPPQPELPAYTRPVSCPRTAEAWYRRPEGILQAAASNACEVAMDAWDSVGSTLSMPERYLQMLRQYPAYYAGLFTYLKDAALHHHSMENLRTAIGRNRQYRQALPSNLSSV
ncbi:MAG: hypothetical protein OES26_12035 [Gammaproteobacteria bacterium]|nr:hypothetical protein [Gammaproteobacteria bacterium]